MTRKSQLRLDAALWGVLVGSVLLAVSFCLMLLGAGPGGSAGGMLGFVARLDIFFLTPAFWISKMLWDDDLTFWRGLAVFWPYCILVSWVPIVLCRKLVTKWREKPKRETETGSTIM